MNSSASGKLATNPLEAKSYLVCKFYILLGDQYDAYPTLKHDNVDCMENCNYLSHTCFLKLEYLSLFWIFWYGVFYTFKWTQLMWIWVKVHQNKFTVKRCPTKWRSKLQGFFEENSFHWPCFSMKTIPRFVFFHMDSAVIVDFLAESNGRSHKSTNPNIEIGLLLTCTWGHV